MSCNKEVKREACPDGKSLRRACYKRRLKTKKRRDSLLSTKTKTNAKYAD